MNCDTLLLATGGDATIQERTAQPRSCFFWGRLPNTSPRHTCFRSVSSGNLVFREIEGRMEELVQSFLNKQGVRRSVQTLELTSAINPEEANNA